MKKRKSGGKARIKDSLKLRKRTSDVLAWKSSPEQSYHVRKRAYWAQEKISSKANNLDGRGTLSSIRLRVSVERRGTGRQSGGLEC